MEKLQTASFVPVCMGNYKDSVAVIEELLTLHSIAPPACMTSGITIGIQRQLMDADSCTATVTFSA